MRKLGKYFDIMQKQEALGILIKAGFKADERISVIDLARLGKPARLSLLREKSTDEETKYNCAAIEITRNWRGYRCRKSIKTLFTRNEPKTSITETEALDDIATDPTRIDSSNEQENATSDATDPSQMLAQQNKDCIPSDVSETMYIPVLLSRDGNKDSYPSDTTETSRMPPHVVHGGNNVLQGVSQDIIQGKSLPLDQSKFGAPKTVKVEPKETITPSNPKTIQRPFNRTQAAIVIQKAWRRHIDMQVFRYYRDLINFRRQGNPALMLRCINPAEAKLLDAATGTHIKFRLAGDKFPPNIYYKIFTHRPVVDMCANSPKDYTKPDSKMATFKQVHTKNLPLPDEKGRDGWYVRIENNGWRLVSDRLIHAAMDNTTWETSQKKVEFHHDKLVRKADLDRKRRRKKIAWMHKMYKDGMLQVRVQDSETSELVKKAADGLINTVDSHGPDGVMDWEVDELLQWTTALNFDDYLEGWKESATSNVSEFEVEEMIVEKVNKQNFSTKVEAYSYYSELPTEKKVQTPGYSTVQVPQT